jgi:predicted SAM-dependent methyltransferase
MYRILKPKGRIKIEVPHFSSHIAYGIGHKHIYTHKELVQMAKEAIKCNIIEATITFYKTFRFVGIMYLANRCPTNYERFWAYIFPAENIKMTLEAIK